MVKINGNLFLYVKLMYLIYIINKNNMKNTKELNDKLQTISNDLLVAIANGKINVQELVEQELKNRGYNKNGKFVGFN
jgi:hypothetical protein